MYHCATYSVWPGPLHTFEYLALTAKTLDTPDLKVPSSLLVVQKFLKFLGV